MGKVLLQWAVPGILSLVGWGVSVMPGNTSWIPSASIWSVAFIWVIISIIFWSRTRKVVKEEKFHFEFNDSSITTKDGRVLLGVNYLPADKVTVETLQLEYNSKRFRPNDWLPIEIKHSHTKNYTFDLNALKTVANETSQEAVFIVKINGIEHRSQPFNIYKLF